jgi:hypothetical protein
MTTKKNSATGKRKTGKLKLDKETIKDLKGKGTVKNVKGGQVGLRPDPNPRPPITILKLCAPTLGCPI